MTPITHTQVQELVAKLPEEKLARAYSLLESLASEETPSPQAAFMRLPLDERRRLLAVQAQDLAQHYQATASEREDWQSGDFHDED